MLEKIQMLRKCWQKFNIILEKFCINYSNNLVVRSIFFTSFLLDRPRSGMRFRDFFFFIGSAISQCGTTNEQHYFRWKWGVGGRKEHKVEPR